MYLQDAHLLFALPRVYAAPSLIVGASVRMMHAAWSRRDNGDGSYKGLDALQDANVTNRMVSKTTCYLTWSTDLELLLC